MPNAVNTGFALDMQRKLYRWSLSDRSKIFSDLFNLVCDRRTLMHAWRRLSGNTGEQHAGNGWADATQGRKSARAAK